MTKTNEQFENRRGDWIKTYTGRRVYPLDFRPEDVHVSDIFHSLSMVARFGGHTTQFYSVGEHSFLVANEVYRRTQDPVAGLQGLLHDAAEAYLGDTVRPLKRCDEFKFIHGVEELILDVILDTLHLPIEIHPEVWAVDQEILVIEGRQLMGGTDGWIIDRLPDKRFSHNVGTLKCLAPTQSKDMLHRLYRELWRKNERIITMVDASPLTTEAHDATDPHGERHG